ncbi:MAG TPA: DedA family protein [Azospirillaceae bacterium]|nr:DedA family protein [Azospirillaceae bacterium]
MVEWIVNTINQLGYAGIFALMVLENVFPPIPSELIMPLAGFAAVRGDMTLLGVLLAGVFGSVVGNLPWYFLGRWLGAQRLRHLAERYGRVLTISPQDVDMALEWFHRFGGMAVFLARMVPAIRTVISAPAGVARMPMVPFLVVTTLGSLLWVGFLTAAGLLLESNYERVQDYVDPVSKIVVVVVVLTYLYRLIRGHGRA